MGSFLAHHEAAFKELGGVPRVVLYDNFKSAFTQRIGDAVVFNPTLLTLRGASVVRAAPVRAVPRQREGPGWSEGSATSARASCPRGHVRYSSTHPPARRRGEPCRCCTGGGAACVQKAEEHR
jgi:hypothetical protein